MAIAVHERNALVLNERVFENMQELEIKKNNAGNRDTQEFAGTRDTQEYAGTRETQEFAGTKDTQE